VSVLVPDIPHPIVLLTGEQGTGKSAAARVLAGLLDPSPAPLRTAPRDLEQWAVGASGSWLVCLDNISRMQEWLSDALCRAATGDGMVRRRLYADSDVSVLAFRRCVLLTSIDAGALRGDLAERLLVFELERLGGRRRTEADLDARERRERPRLLGALFDLTSQVLAVLDGIRLDQLPRMADFARVVAAVDHVLGTDGLARYLAQSGRIATDVLEGDPVAVALLELVTEAGTVEEPAGVILDRLDARRGDGRIPRGWPTSPQGMAGALKRLAPSMRTVGIEVDYLGQSGHDNRRAWYLTAEQEAPDETERMLATLAPVNDASDVPNLSGTSTSAHGWHCPDCGRRWNDRSDCPASACPSNAGRGAA
jgi:energy-coupling factor transporter ATP-binding protein EcfA2